MSQTTWNLQILFKNDDDPAMAENLKDVEKQSYKFINKWNKRKDYLQKPKILKQALDDYETWAKNVGTSGNVGYYLALRSAQEQDNPKLKAKAQKLEDFSIKIANDIQFFTHKIAKIPQRKQKAFLENKELSEYKHLLENLFEDAKYLLSEKEEKLLTLKSSVAHSNWVSMTSEFLAKEQKKVLNDKQKFETKTFSQIISLLNDRNKATRDSAAKAFNQILKKHSDVAEHELNSILANKKINDELRKIPRPDKGRHINDDIDTEVVDTLLKAVSDRFEISQKYYELKAKLLNTDKLEYHERNVEYGKIDKKYTYQDAIKVTHKTFTKLDPTFAKILTTLVQKGNVDVYPKKGKAGGAFCASNFITQPTYILLNHTGRLRDVLTLAHEMGHAINNELMKEKQNSLNFRSPLSTAEVASTFMEDFVLDEIIAQSDDDLKLAIMMLRLNNEVSSIQRQIACYTFEQELHQEFREIGYLPKAKVGKLFQKHMKAYMGRSVEQSPGSQNWWVYWSHIRRFFYVYSYASGTLISKSLQNSVKQNPKFIKKVKAFLAAGTKESPKEIFLKLNVDITRPKFWQQGLDEQQQLVEQTWTLAKKLGKI